MLNSVKIVIVATILQWLVSSVVAQGSWQQLQKNAGISSMHSAVTRYDTVIMLDRTNIGPSQIKLPNGRCRNQPLERVSKKDCYAHSVMFNPSNGGVRPLFVYTDTWCSSGQFMGNGMMVQTGGDFEGNKKIRYLLVHFKTIMNLFKFDSNFKTWTVISIIHELLRLQFSVTQWHVSFYSDINRPFIAQASLRLCHPMAREFVL